MQRCLVTLPVLILNLSTSCCVWAQAQEPTQLPQITVTGSRIPKLQSQTNTPTLVLQRTDIVRTGAHSVRELLDTLTGASQVESGAHHRVSDISGGNLFASGSSSVSLRHLGHQATLVLLNSRRLAPFALDDDHAMFISIDTLPMDAIERVEVLQSGGSAIYGADAIAGVVNIITRQDYRGIQVRAHHEQSLRNPAFRTDNASITAGLGDDEASPNPYNLLMNLEFFNRSAVAWRDALGQVNPELGKFSQSFGSASSYSYPGNVNGQAIDGCSRTASPGGLCLYDRYARMQAQPSAQRVNGLISGQLQINPQLKFFSELLYGFNQTRYFSAPNTYGAPNVSVWFSPRSGQAQYFVERGLPKEHPLNPTGLDDTDFRHRFSEVENTTVVNASNYRFLAGLKGVHQKLQWEVALGTSASRVRKTSRGAFSDSGFKAVIGDYNAPSDPLFFNRAYRINQPNSAQTLNTLFPQFSAQGKTTQTFLDGKIVQPLPHWMGRKIDVAAGFDLRHETVALTPSNNLEDGDIVGVGSAKTHAQRTFGALFGEVNLAWSERLELQGAARLDHYPGFATHLAPKIGMRFMATPQWLLRGALESGFRAPNLTENASATRYDFASPIQDPKRCPQAQILARNLQTAAQNLPETDPQKNQLQARADMVLGQECTAGLAAQRASNPYLRPEKSTSLGFGMAFQPTSQYFASLDYFAIRRRGEIGYKTPQELVNNENNLPAGTVNRLSPGQDTSFTDAERTALGVKDEPLSYTSSQIENTSKTSTSGLDLSVQTRTLTRLGAFTGQVQATYLLNYQQWSPLRAGYGDNLAGRYGYARLRGSFSAAITQGSFTHALRLNLTSGTTLHGDFYDELYTPKACADRGWSADHCRLGRHSTVDYMFSYAQKRKLAVHVHVQNVFNQRPPLDLRAFFENGGGIAPQNLSDAQGRTLKLAIEYKL
jgi:iron complex outermembrane recepter protein